MADEKIEVLEKRALTLPMVAEKLMVVDQVTYDQAGEMLKGFATLAFEIKDHHAPLKEAAFKAHKTIVAAEKRLLDPIDRASMIVRGKVSEWVCAQERIRLEAQRKAEEAARESARKESEEASIHAAIEAEASGASAEEVESLMENIAPLEVSVPTVAKTFTPSSGISSVERWSAEVTDLKALCQAVGQGLAPLASVEASMPYLNKRASAEKSTFNIPGVKAVKSTGISVRRQS
jgi:hypothetical protein